MNTKSIFSTSMTRLLALSFLFSVSIQTWAVTSSYYSSLEGLKDSTLRSAITTLIYTKHTTALGYNWTFDGIDVVNNEVLDMYSTCTWTVTTDQCGNYDGICDCYNREHIVPQSLFNKQSPQVGDRHHLFLTDGKVNGVRSDYAFGENSATNTWSGLSNSTKALGQLGSATDAYSSSVTVFEPDDQYKGDIARAILYMAVRYATSNECRAYNGTSNSYPVTAWSSNEMFSGSLSTNYGLSDAAVQTFLKWHRADKVSSKEIARNSGVEAKQGNRNPFVDYPALVEYLWGTKKGTAFSVNDVVGSFESSFVPGTSDGFKDGSSSTTNYTITWSVNGSTSTTTSNGSSVGTLPSAPSAPSGCSAKTFVGWSTTNIGSTEINTAPSTLFTQASGAPAITGNITFYAVFATANTTSGGGTTNGSKTFTFSEIASANNWSNGTAYTTVEDAPVTLMANGGGNNGKYYTSDTSWRMYSGGSVSITVADGSVTSVSSTPSQTFTISDGVATLSLSGTVKFTEITVNYTVTGGSSTTYSGYITTCSASSSCTTAPTVGAASTSNETTTSATVICSAGITSLGSTGCSVSSYGFVYGTNATPALASGTQKQVGTSYTTTGASFSTSLTGLNPNTIYYVRPYATNGKGTSYGTQASFQTSPLASYTITWTINGTTTSENYTEGSILTIPTPSDCSSGNRVFRGWTTSSSYSGDGTDLVTPTSPVTANAHYYAVYATVSSGSGGGGSVDTDDFELYSGSITEGDYLITYDNGAMNTTISNNRLQITSVTPSNDVVTTTEATIIWHIAQSGSYWTIYNAGASKYAAANGTKNQAALNADGTDNKSLWTISGDGTYEFVNKNNSANSVNANLRKNGTYGFACYGTTTGGALTLYKRVTTSGGSGTTTYTDYSTSCSTTTYTITWNANGGTCLTTTTEISAGGAIGTLPTATKEGHSFVGWFTAATSGSQIYASTVPTGNAEYFAQYTPNTYTVSYNKGTNGTGTNTTAQKTYDVDLTLQGAIFTREGYEQTGWSGIDGGTKAFDLEGTYTENKDTTLYPYWTALPTYTVTFKVGTDNHATFEGWAGKSISGISTPSACDGYTFVGWSTQQYGTTNTSAPSIDYTGLVPATNTTYYAVFSTNGVAVGTTLWAENFAHFDLNMPSAAGTGIGTTIYGGATITYAQSVDNNKGYNECLAGGTSPELFIAKSSSTWTISGIKMANATALSLTFLSNKTTFSVTTNETTKLTMGGSGKSWTISLNSGQTAPETFNIIISNTSNSSNARIDNVELKVTAIDDKGAVFTTSKTFTVTIKSLNNSQGTVNFE